MTDEKCYRSAIEGYGCRDTEPTWAERRRRDSAPHTHAAKVRGRGSQPAGTSDGDHEDRDPESNPDGSVDVYFGPHPPTGKERNWIPTVPGRGWFTILRL